MELGKMNYEAMLEMEYKKLLLLEDICFAMKKKNISKNDIIRKLNCTKKEIKLLFEGDNINLDLLYKICFLLELNVNISVNKQ